MPHDKEMEKTLGRLLASRGKLTSRKMFGGVCYLLQGNMALGIHEDRLIVRLGSDEAAREEISAGRALPFDITGRPMKGWVMVPRALLEEDADYEAWIERGLAFAGTLPPK